jgi:uncharacterized protein YecE (DUF72 family)
LIRIGTAGWSIPRELAAAFPGEGTHLERYARVLPCAEINSSFKRAHRRGIYAKWAAQTPRTFRFAIKLPQDITHQTRLRGTRSSLADFLDQVGGLGRRLGPLLVQLPPSLDFETRIASLFFALMRKQHTGAIVCEPRHPSWFSAAAESLMVRHRIARVAADPAVVPAAALPAGDRAIAYFRPHGAPRTYWSRYDAAQLDAWIARMLQFKQQSEVWCVFDNTAGNSALDNALAVSAGVNAGRRAPAAALKRRR